MKHLFKIGLLLFLLPALLHAGPEKGAHTKRKKINNTYTVNKDCLVDIKNEFGNVTITTWDAPTVFIEVTVEVSGNDEERVMQQLKEIDVQFKASASLVSAVTVTSKRSNNSSGFWDMLFNRSSNQNSNMKINYLIKMPVTASLDIKNDYGTIVLDRLEGRAKIKCDFGRLDIGQLLAKNNYIAFDYTNDSHIDYMKSGEIRADFSDFDVYGADNLYFQGDYSKGRFHNVKDLEFKADFCTVQSDEAIKVVGRGDYSTIRLGNISQSVDLKTDFGSIQIKELQPSFSSAILKTEYTGIKINYHPQAAFNFNIDAEYASIKLSDDLTVTSSVSESTEKKKSGFSKQENLNATIKINSSFGSVNLKRN